MPTIHTQAVFTMETLDISTCSREYLEQETVGEAQNVNIAKITNCYRFKGTTLPLIALFWSLQFLLIDNVVLHAEMGSISGQHSSSHTLYMDKSKDFFHYFIFGQYQKLCHSSIHMLCSCTQCEMRFDNWGLSPHQ